MGQIYSFYSFTPTIQTWPEAVTWFAAVQYSARGAELTVRDWELSRQSLKLNGEKKMGRRPQSLFSPTFVDKIKFTSLRPA